METPSPYWPTPTLAEIRVPQQTPGAALDVYVKDLMRQGATEVQVLGWKPDVSTFLASKPT